MSVPPPREHGGEEERIPNRRPADLPAPDGQALVESCLRYGTGARIWLGELCERDAITPFEALFAESTARAVVAVPRSEEVRFADMCTARGVPVQRIGVTDDAEGDEPAAGTGPVLEVQDLFTIGLAELAETHRATLPRYFD